MKRHLIFTVLIVAGLSLRSIAQTSPPAQTAQTPPAATGAAVGQQSGHSNPHAGYPMLEIVFAGMTAIGTLGASVLALFGPRIRTWLIRPVLTFRVDPKVSPLVEQLARDDLNTSAGKNSYYEIRVEVANTGKDAARNCRARVNAIYKQKSGTNDFFAARQFVPRYLYWAKKDTKSEESLDILPNLPEYVVIGRLKEQETPTTGAESPSGTSTSAFGLEMAVEPEGAKGRFCFLGAGRVVLPFLLYADNLRSYEQKYVEVFWNGESATDFGSEHFGVKLLSKEEGDALVRRAQ